MPVYDLETGRVVGRVRRLIVDPDERRVVGLLLAGRLGKEPQCLPFRDVHAVGEHAVTVRGTDAIVPVSELPEMQEALRSRRRLYHAPILTEGGRFLGDVDEYTVNPRSGRIEALLLSGGLIRDLFRGQAVLPAHLVLTIGEDALIVRDQAVGLLEPRAREGAEGPGARSLPHGSAGGAAQPHAAAASPPRARTAAQRLRAVFSGWRRRSSAAGEDPPAPKETAPSPPAASGRSAAPGPSPALGGAAPGGPPAPGPGGPVPAGRTADGKAAPENAAASGPAPPQAAASPAGSTGAPASRPAGADGTAAP